MNLRALLIVLLCLTAAGQVLTLRKRLDITLRFATNAQAVTATNYLRGLIMANDTDDSDGKVIHAWRPASNMISATIYFVSTNKAQTSFDAIKQRAWPSGVSGTATLHACPGDNAARAFNCATDPAAEMQTFSWP